jgi:hypothetical protein
MQVSARCASGQYCRETAGRGAHEPSPRFKPPTRQTKPTLFDVSAQVVGENSCQASAVIYQLSAGGRRPSAWEPAPG